MFIHTDEISFNIAASVINFFWDMIPECEIVVETNSQINYGIYFLKWI